MIVENVLDLIGNTPVVKLNKIIEKYNLPFNLYAKVERFNLSGSVKDRAAYQIIKDALDNKIIDENTEIIEATSGNTGISLAMISSYLNLKCTIVMPESASIERVKMMKAFGANVILTDRKLGMQGSVDLANKLASENKNSFLAKQFENESNIKAHYLNTANEIYNDFNNNLDYLIAGFGTGGTISGSAKRLKELIPNIKVVGVEPKESSLILNKKAGSHKIQGIGANFIPSNFRLDYLDKVISVSDKDAYFYTKELAKVEALFCGISSGAALAGIFELDFKELKNKNILIILPDNGERYLSLEGLYE